ncbi:MAG: MmcQ/YjbR family DNA-binding protein [Xanthobacteraceae bacterium]
MTAGDFRRLVLAMPGAAESAHSGHPDFRVGQRIFATLGYPDSKWAMVKLNPEQQDLLTSAEPDIFSAAKGAWGKRGSTLLLLERADEKTALSAIRMAWTNLQP